jgi:hypothetical protein
MNQGITYNPQVASIAQQLVAQNQPIGSVIDHVGPNASLAALVNAFKQAKDRAAKEAMQNAAQAGNDGGGFAGMLPQNKTVADEVYASLQQGQAPQQEPTAMMAHGGLASLPSYNFMPQNYEHGGIVAFTTGDEVEALLREGEPVTREGSSDTAEKKTPKSTSQKIKDVLTKPRTVTETAKPVGKGLLSLSKGILASPATYIPSAAGALASTVAGGSPLEGLDPENFARALGEGYARYAPTFLGGLTPEEIRAGDEFGASDIRSQKEIEKDSRPVANAATAAAAAAASRPPTPTPEAPTDIAKYFAATGSAGGAGAGAGGYRDNPALMKSRSELIKAFEARVREANPGKQEDLDALTKARYDKAGIGKAAEAEQARIAKREAGLGEESKAAFWRDLSKAGFSMAAFAGKRGREATGFLGALAAGGQDFSESNIKTAARFNELKESLADKQAALAQAQENVALGVLKESSAEFRDRSKAYETAKDKVLGYQASMVEEEIKAGRALEVARMQIGAANARDNNKSEEQIKRAIIEANKKGDLKAVEALQKILTGISPSMYGAGLRADAVAAASEQKNLTAFNKDINVQMIRRQLSDPNITAQKQQALQAQLKQYADNYKISSSGMPGGGTNISPEDASLFSRYGI